ncbi:MAG: hypothetical protein R2881_02245 [Eubacteriales bacterium]
MQQWDVVGVIATLVALFAAIVAPMIKLHRRSAADDGDGASGKKHGLPRR